MWQVQAKSTSGEWVNVSAVQPTLKDARGAYLWYAYQRPDTDIRIKYVGGGAIR